jgi:hypothetical protein
VLRVQYADLDPVEVQPGSEYLLGHLYDLSSTRSYSFSGPLPITFTELQAYMAVTGEQLSPWEIDVIRKLDAIIIQEHYAKDNHGNSGRTNLSSKDK